VVNLPFVGRKAALEQLNQLLHKKTATLAVVSGRRRIGKSRLIEEFAKDYRFLEFAGIPPDTGVTAQDQRDVFAHRIGQTIGLPSFRANNWSDLFQMLAEQTRDGRVIILLDEISWMAMDDPTFLGILKNAWDLEFKKNPQLILIICGSVSTWIEKNILSSTGYFGRVPLTLHLSELTLYDCHKLIEAQQFIGSNYEKFQLLSITGGVPWYLELIPVASTAQQCIRQLCFRKKAPLVNEFDRIFHDLFDSRGTIYKRIISLLANGPLEYIEICKQLDYSEGGVMSDYLNELIISNFITRDYTWDFKKKKYSRLSKFRLSDNYLRFYLKFIEPQIENINRGYFEQALPQDLPGWNTIMGLQFENLVLRNRKSIFKLLGLNPTEILLDNPYYQHKTTRQRGCQIDYLIQTRLNTLFIIEIKFSKNELKTNIITEVQEKIHRLAIPRGYSCIPVLIHVNGVSDVIQDQGYFYKIIDMGDLFSIPDDD
jgi:AAA+ ATPase superfamily predicted ATPase